MDPKIQEYVNKLQTLKLDIDSKQLGEFLGEAKALAQEDSFVAIPNLPPARRWI